VSLESKAGVLHESESMTPYIHCTMPMARSALLPNGYAMISCRAVRRAIVLFAFRAAERSAPMMGIERSSFSRRTILFLIVVLGAPIAARSATLEDSAKELADKITAGLPARESVSVDVRNISSLPPAEFAAVERTLRDELENLKVPVATTGAVAINVRITLSENIKGLLLTAEITHGDTSQVILMPASRPSEFRIASYLMPIVLHSKIIWEGPEQLLDAATASGLGGFSILVLLLRDGLEIHDSAGVTSGMVAVPSAGIATRNPRGKLEINGTTALAVIQFQACTINLNTMQLLECHSAASQDEELAEEVPHDLLSTERSAEMLMPQNGCGAALAAGSGDYTQADSLQAFSVKPAGLAVSNKLDFSGPVLALRSGSGGSRAIVRNLKTGNYEAYSISCGK
jgi:hypothetical protein